VNENPVQANVSRGGLINEAEMRTHSTQSQGHFEEFTRAQKKKIHIHKNSET
jgi:hypothetical protein